MWGPTDQPTPYRTQPSLLTCASSLTYARPLLFAHFPPLSSCLRISSLSCSRFLRVGNPSEGETSREEGRKEQKKVLFLGTSPLLRRNQHLKSLRNLLFPLFSAWIWIPAKKSCVLMFFFSLETVVVWSNPARLEQIWVWMCLNLLEMAERWKLWLNSCILLLCTVFFCWVWTCGCVWVCDLFLVWWFCKWMLNLSVRLTLNACWFCYCDLFEILVYLWNLCLWFMIQDFGVLVLINRRKSRDFFIVEAVSVCVCCFFVFVSTPIGKISQFQSVRFRVSLFVLHFHKKKRCDL